MFPLPFKTHKKVHLNFYSINKPISTIYTSIKICITIGGMKYPIAWPFLKLLLQVGTVVAPIVFKSFREAYKNAALRSGAYNNVMDKVIKNGPKEMTEEEARLILGLTKESFEKLSENYERLYKANDPTKGGSFYLQSKIYRAKEFLDKTNK